MHDLLRSVWDEPRPPDPPRRVWRDWALLVVLAPTAVLEGLLRPELSWRAVWAIILIALLPTLLWRRTRPLLMVAIAFGLTGLAPLVLGSPQWYTMAYLLILPYALFRWGSGPAIVLGSAILLAKVGVSMPLGYLSLADAVAGFVVLFAVTALGAALRYRATVRMRTLEQVKLLERERLARDLHDTVAHHVSAIAIRAQAGLATVAAQPDAAVEALRVIEAEASRALAEMRTMVRVLRRDLPAELAPSPRIGDLAELAGARASLPVDVEILGSVDDVAPAVATAIYRLAQESVTNARRHARHATRIVVRVAADNTSVHLCVTDDGDHSVVRPVAAAPGYGLIGMIERADLLGGTFAAGPNPDRGWTVNAVLPRAGATA